ncbi:sulfatase-like hydrolase/transferase [Mucisphaera calidilacus]|uniref:Arylsulfatase n=1 Tax=Mucisphaera calidilacus TaxID=2527982 RepID=A0A518BWX8_9BACT|nr:sulfatase-like hydrolase/transferase [Mucisphaera calidilacus]QDU71475.1 Arylsulfatase [Mucisphaera calidilacus]
MSKPVQAIVIMTDTQRKDMFGCYRDTGLRTPNVDRLASQGVRFENAYCCSPVCGPARSALFTGQYPHSNGGWGNGMAIDAITKTLGQRITDATDGATQCGYVGKWHLDGGDYFGMGRCPEGYDPDYWYDMRCYLDELSPEDRLRSRDVASNQAEGGFPRELTFAHRCSSRAIDFIRRHRDESFCLVLSYDEPHGPSLCPEPFASMYRDYRFPPAANGGDDLRDKPEIQRLWAGDNLDRDMDNHACHAPDFFGCHSFVDDEIGRVLEVIDDNTPESLVIFTSDHGDMLGSHRLERSGKGPAMYQEITNIPWIVRWPGQTPEGAVSDALISHIDLTPTLLQHFGIPIPRLLQGIDQHGAFTDPAVSLRDEVFIEWGRYEMDHDGFLSFQPIRCVFDGRYKLAVNLMDTDELYDVQADPGELKNLIHDPPDRARRDRLHDVILDWMSDTRDPFRGDYWRRRPWRVDAPPASWAYTGMTRQREHTEYEPHQLDYDTGLDMTEAVRPK